MKFAKLIFKNILRNKRRTVLTISSLVVSLFLIIFLATILTEFDRGSDQSSPLRLARRQGSDAVQLVRRHLQRRAKLLRQLRGRREQTENSPAGSKNVRRRLAVFHQRSTGSDCRSQARHALRFSTGPARLVKESDL